MKREDEVQFCRVGRCRQRGTGVRRSRVLVVKRSVAEEPCVFFWSPGGGVAQYAAVLAEADVATRATVSASMSRPPAFVGGAGTLRRSGHTGLMR